MITIIKVWIVKRIYKNKGKQYIFTAKHSCIEKPKDTACHFKNYDIFYNYFDKEEESKVFVARCFGEKESELLK